MSTNSHALDRILSLALQPWAITPVMLRTIASVLGHRLAYGPRGSLTDLAALVPASLPNAPAQAASGGSIALIPLHGVIAPRMTLLTDISGGATFEEAGLALQAAIADDQVSTIVFDVDSPGGSVLGCREFAHAVLKARTIKPIVAVANFEMCSAAYWVSACATEVVAAPSAMVGSIGVYMIHDDLSKALEQLGITRTLISAGTYKTEGHESIPLTDDAKDYLQALVDEKFGQFCDDVARGRGITADAVRTGYGQGRVVTADTAIRVGLVDRIDTLEATLIRLGASTPRDTLQEPDRVTNQDRVADRALERALMELNLLM